MKKLILAVTIIATSFANFAQVGIGTTSPHASAALDISSTTKGFLPPRMTSAQLLTLKNNAPLEGLMVYCIDCTTKGLFVFNGTYFMSLINGIEEIPTVTTSTGKVWMDRNLGASRVATSSADKQSYGNFYQWGKKVAVANHSGIIGSWDSSGGNTNDTAWNETTKEVEDPCPAGFRVPSTTELDNERATFTPQNTAGAYNNLLRLPANGNLRGSDGDHRQADNRCNYWTSSANGINADHLFVTINEASFYKHDRSGAFAVRCIKE